MADNGTFPAKASILDDEDFQNQKNEYFGGQQVNKVLVAAAKRKVSTFQYLPYNPYAQTKYGDDVAPAYQGKKTLKQAMADYANTMAEYGRQQGYTVTVK